MIYEVYNFCIVKCVHAAPGPGRVLYLLWDRNRQKIRGGELINAH